MTGTPLQKSLSPALSAGPAAQPGRVPKLPDEVDVTDGGQDCDTLVLGGDIDEETYSALIEALNHVPRNSAALCVDLAAVTFCDLAGLWAIVRLAESAAPVILHGVPAPLRAVMEILGWDAQPGLVISQGQHGKAD